MNGRVKESEEEIIDHWGYIGELVLEESYKDDLKKAIESLFVLNGPDGEIDLREHFSVDVIGYMENNWNHIVISGTDEDHPFEYTFQVWPDEDGNPNKKLIEFYGNGIRHARIDALCGENWSLKALRPLKKYPVGLLTTYNGEHKPENIKDEIYV